MNKSYLYIRESVYNKYERKRLVSIHKSSPLIVFFQSLKSNMIIPVIFTDKQIEMELHKLNININDSRIIGYCDLSGYVKSVKGTKLYSEIFKGMMMFLNIGGIIKVDDNTYDRKLMDYFKINES